VQGEAIRRHVIKPEYLSYNIGIGLFMPTFREFKGETDREKEGTRKLYRRHNYELTTFYAHQLCKRM